MVLGSDDQTAGGVWAVPLMLGHSRGGNLGASCSALPLIRVEKPLVSHPEVVDSVC